MWDLNFLDSKVIPLLSLCPEIPKPTMYYCGPCASLEKIKVSEQCNVFLEAPYMGLCFFSFR